MLYEEPLIPVLDSGCTKLKRKGDLVHILERQNINTLKRMKSTQLRQKFTSIYMSSSLHHSCNFIRYMLYKDLKIPLLCSIKGAELLCFNRGPNF